ncbi:MAG: MBL fold metallo-hydrolase [Thermoguttaceae bacterium]|nr:MBL fold metallo-hydrolase [Thermoguttaceae bacterium]
MIIQQIRNATLKIEYAGKTFLIDPWLAPKGGMGSFAQTPFRPGADVDPAMYDAPMPLVDLPEPVESVLAGVDFYLLTHLHPDHFDMDMRTGRLGPMLNKRTPIYVQNGEEAALLRENRFAEVGYLQDAGVRFGRGTVYRVGASHGEEKPCGPSSGLVFRSPDEKTLYIAGDTVWYEGVLRNLKTFEPDVVVLNACAASLEGYGHLITDDEAIERVHAVLPGARIVASHMDTVAHATLTRKTLREKLQKRGLADMVLIPEDGEKMTF